MRFQRRLTRNTKRRFLRITFFHLRPHRNLMTQRRKRLLRLLRILIFRLRLTFRLLRRFLLLSRLLLLLRRLVLRRPVYCLGENE